MGRPRREKDKFGNLHDVHVRLALLAFTQQEVEEIVEVYFYV